MFTIKFYSGDGCRQIIREAESFTILRSPVGGDGGAEITMHQKSGESCRFDVGDEGPNGPARSDGWPPVFSKAIIENAVGKTTEIISAFPRVERAA